MKSRNLLITVAVVGTLIALVFVIPMPHRVSCSAEVVPRDAKTVYVVSPGRLVQLAVLPGQTVQEGDLICELENLELDLEIAQYEAEQAQVTEQIEFRNAQRTLWGENVDRDLILLKDRLATIEKKLQEKQLERENLTIRSPATGVVLPPSSRPAPKSEQLDGQLAPWSGTPLDPENDGLTLTKGDELCRIGPGQEMDAVLVIDQTDRDFVNVGFPVWVCLDAYPGQILESTVESISQDPMRDTSKGLSNQGGGELATRMDAAGHLRPLSTSYQAKAALPTDHPLRPGQRGRAKIVVAPETWGNRFLRYLAHTFRFRL